MAGTKRSFPAPVAPAKGYRCSAERTPLTVKGVPLRLTDADMTLNPNYMADWGENHVTYTFRVEGETLYLTWPEGFMGDGSPRFIGTFRKVG